MNKKLSLLFIVIFIGAASAFANNLQYYWSWGQMYEEEAVGYYNSATNLYNNNNSWDYEVETESEYRSQISSFQRKKSKLKSALSKAESALSSYRSAANSWSNAKSYAYGDGTTNYSIASNAYNTMQNKIRNTQNLISDIKEVISDINDQIEELKDNLDEIVKNREEEERKEAEMQAELEQYKKEYDEYLRIEEEKRLQLEKEKEARIAKDMEESNLRKNLSKEECRKNIDAPANIYDFFGYQHPDWGSSIDEVIAFEKGTKYVTDNSNFIIYIARLKDDYGYGYANVYYTYHFYEGKFVNVVYEYYFDTDKGDEYHFVSDDRFKRITNVYGDNYQYFLTQQEIPVFYWLNGEIDYSYDPLYYYYSVGFYHPYWIEDYVSIFNVESEYFTMSYEQLLEIAQE